ncbi:NAD(P)/FAD-dependent oxidoreductase [Cellulophaga sp. HaHaR_3_176]|uniref:NAD(P)/FAD-dependent oxidoreductase n=1 Tax=Cellulophaga sp. HaHaR_3_176 TaxID=1942464 RepID=UPI001C1F2995|nr:NAD(P)/FAD-dependent oxidoreductase [Cellulophaga sp. HaHaR_3_176]QWX85140.1 NAD(P)/FAD-dependent oxidoreductase [Cellulophaga sp. HaHaR_3_176]
MKIYDTIIIGGGLAGLTAAIHLAKNNHRVLIFEKQKYPHHKVCGEYVSNEIIPYLINLGVFLPDAININTLQFSTVQGRTVTTKLPLGGVGISRYALDFLLYNRAQELKVSFVFEGVNSVYFSEDIFHIKTESGLKFISKTTIGAFGKRSNMDKHLQRNFMKKKSSWLGVKAHFELPDFPKHLVALHNFKGGYGGLSTTETGAINFCYLVNYKRFKKLKDINDFNLKIVSENPFLGSFLKDAKPIFDQPLSIAQISFEKKETVENHMLMCGDSAGLIHPLCGNGMAMAIHSAKIASELLVLYLNSSEPNRKLLEVTYKKRWNKAFKYRLWIGRKLQWLLLNDNLSNIAMKIVAKSPKLLRLLIKQTHGKPITC